MHVKARFFPCGQLVLASLVLSACAVGPDYQAPQPVTASHFNAMAGGVTSEPQSGAVQPQWWKTFQDPQLNSLIERAVCGNLNLQQTVLRIAASRQQLNQARGGWFPQVDANLQVTRQQPGIKGELESRGVYDQLDGSNSGPEIRSALDGLTRPVTLYQGNFDASWELDLWGRVRRQVEVAGSQQQQDIENRNDALVSLEAEVARTYLQLRGVQGVARTVETQIAVAQQMLELTHSQQRNGMAPQMDVENARAQLSLLRAQLPQYQSQTRQAMNALAVLMGKMPGALDGELHNDQALPPLPASVAVGVPSTLARRRPDIRSAEAQLHAATASIGIAVAQLFPSLTLTGQFGVRNTDASYLDNWSSHFYSVGPGLSIPLFQGGRLVASVKLARARQASAALGYRQTVLTALQEVENALVSYHADQQQVAGLQESVAAWQNAFSLASASYRQGLSTFIEVLDAQRQLAQSRQQLASAQMQSGVDLVALYKALGGGWESYQPLSLPEFPVFGAAEQG